VGSYFLLIIAAIMKYISILGESRSSSTGDHGMDDLLNLYRELGYTSVQSFLDGVNVLFEGDGSETEQEISVKISKAIEKKFGFKVPVIARTVKNIELSIKVNPFAKIYRTDTKSLHLTMLSEVPTEKVLTEIEKVSSPPDEFTIVEKDVFLHCFGKYEDSKLNTHFFEDKLGVLGATRKWQIVTKLVDTAKRLEKEAAAELANNTPSTDDQD